MTHNNTINIIIKALLLKIIYEYSFLSYISSKAKF